MVEEKLMRVELPSFWFARLSFSLTLSFFLHLSLSFFLSFSHSCNDRTFSFVCERLKHKALRYKTSFAHWTLYRHSNWCRNLFIIWAYPRLFLLVFILLTLEFEFKLIKQRYCAWDSNRGPQDGRRGAMTAHKFWYLLSSWFVTFYHWDMLALSILELYGETFDKSYKCSMVIVYNSIITHNVHL